MARRARPWLIVCRWGARLRDCKFVVADKNMEFVIKGFFGRADFHHKLGCAQFAFDPSQDLHSVRGKNDPGLYANGDPVLRVCRQTHRYAVVILDAEWKGSPGAAKIEERIKQHLAHAGLSPQESAAIVIDPELENWLWIPHNTLGNLLGWQNFQDLREFLRKQQLWTDGDKPAPPKQALELVLKRIDKPRSSKFYAKIVQSVPSVRRCKDASFLKLRDTLCIWFSVEAS